jgi:hypothetical protein
MRPTQGIDFVPSSTGENLDRLAGALRELGARLRVAGMTDEEARQLPVVVDGPTLAAFGSTTWATDAGSIDVLHDLPTATGRRSYDDLLSRSTTASLDGVVIRVAALSDIIDSKQHPDRTKDRLRHRTRVRPLLLRQRDLARGHHQTERADLFDTLIERAETCS